MYAIIYNMTMYKDVKVVSLSGTLPSLRPLQFTAHNPVYTTLHCDILYTLLYTTCILVYALLKTVQYTALLTALYIVLYTKFIPYTF